MTPVPGNKVILPPGQCGEPQVIGGQWREYGTHELVPTDYIPFTYMYISIYDRYKCACICI